MSLSYPFSYPGLTIGTDNMTANNATCVACHGDFGSDHEVNGLCVFCRLFGQPSMPPSSTPTTSPLSTHIALSSSPTSTETSLYSRATEGTAATTATTHVTSSPHEMSSMMQSLPLPLQQAFRQSHLPVQRSLPTANPATAAAESSSQSYLGSGDPEDYCFCDLEGRPSCCCAEKFDQ